MASVDGEGFPNMNGMSLPRKVIALKIFYFTITVGALGSKLFCENQKSSIYFCNPLHYIGVMLKGMMEALEEQKIKAMLWQETDSVYCEGGVVDPNCCVHKFTAVSGCLYRNFTATHFAI